MNSNTVETHVAQDRRDFISRGETSINLTSVGAHGLASGSDRPGTDCRRQEGA